ncbi:hypothetical protein GCM10027570_47240 [Streptomonospora sediminis]
MSKSDPTGPSGRRRSRRDAPARAPRERTEADDTNTDRGTDDDTPAANTRRGGRSGRGRGAAREADTAPQGRTDSPGRSGKGARGGKNGRRAASSAQQAGGRRAGRTSAGLDPVSKFSASALRRVSVLGDGPNQIVHNLAEQSRRKRGSAMLGTLLVLCGTSLLALLGVLGYQLASAPAGGPGLGGSSSAIVAPPEGHSTLVPALYQAQPQDDAFEPIAERGGPSSGTLVKDDVFSSGTEELELDGSKLVRDQAEVTETCTSLVWGEEVAQSLVDGDCTSAGSAVYLSGNEEYVAQFALFDLADSEAAGDVAAALDPGDSETAPGFLLPQKGGMDGLHKGYSQATAQVMGHYLAVYWVASADGSEPGDDDTRTLSTLNVAAMNASTWVYRQVEAAEQQ